MTQESAFCNLAAEEAFIANLHNSTDAAKHVHQLEPDDFSDSTHKMLFEALRDVVRRGKLITVPEVAEALKRLRNAEDLITDYTRIWRGNYRGQAWALDSNVQIIKEKSQRRKQHRILVDAARKLEAPENDAEAVRDTVRQQLRDMIPTTQARRSLLDGMVFTFEQLERRTKGEITSIPTGISSIDHKTGGFHRGELTVLGARPAVGKSALGVHIAVSAAEAGNRVLVCSREMTEEQYHLRLLARWTDVSPRAMRNGTLSGKEWAQITDATSNFSTLPLEFLFTAAYIEDLRMEVQNKVDTDGLDLLVVDYMQLMQSRSRFEKDYLRVGYISRALKEIALDFNVAVVALAQVGRSAQGDMPTMAELRGSGDIEQDADNILFMHRPESGNDPNVRPDHRNMFTQLNLSGLQYMALAIAKQRQGETGRFAVLFNPAKMTFTDIPRAGRGGNILRK